MIRSALRSLEEYKLAQGAGWNPYLLAMATQRGRRWCLRCGALAYVGYQHGDGPLLWYCPDHVNTAFRPEKTLFGLRATHVVYDEMTEITDEQFLTLRAALDR